MSVKTENLSSRRKVSEQKVEKNELAEPLVIAEEPTKKEKEIDLKGLLFSWKFVLMYVITLCKSGVNLYYGNEAKFLSLKMIEDDGFITTILLVGVVINVCMRVSMGRLEKVLGFGNIYILNLILNMLTSILPLFLGAAWLRVILFIFMQRSSNGKFSFGDIMLWGIRVNLKKVYQPYY